MNKNYILVINAGSATLKFKVFELVSLKLVKQGIVDPLDAEKTIGNIDPEFTAKQFNYRDFA